jgi:hypothetical protein
VNRLQLREVAACEIKNAIRIVYQLPRDRVTEPQAADLVARQALCPRGQLLEVSATNPTMRSGSAKR